jgi:hypothetical protein
VTVLERPARVALELIPALGSVDAAEDSALVDEQPIRPRDTSVGAAVSGAFVNVACRLEARTVREARILGWSE